MAKIEVTAEVTGNVWKIQAKIGDVLAEEGVIMILESIFWNPYSGIHENGDSG